MGTSGAFGGSGAWSGTVESLYDAADSLNSGTAALPGAVMSALGKSLSRERTVHRRTCPERHGDRDGCHRCGNRRRITVR